MELRFNCNMIDLEVYFNVLSTNDDYFKVRNDYDMVRRDYDVKFSANVVILRVFNVIILLNHLLLNYYVNLNVRFYVNENDFNLIIKNVELFYFINENVFIIYSFLEREY